MAHWLTLLVLLLIPAVPGHAQTVVQKHVTWDLDALVGHPAGGFILSFQLTDGSGVGNGSTTVALSNSSLSAFALTDSAFFQLESRNLSPTTGVPLEFDLTFTYTGTDAPTPDQFSFAILDGSGYELPTIGPADASATVDVTDSGLQIATFAGDTSREPNAMGPPIALAAPVITNLGGETPAVPEPGALALFLPALGALAVSRRRRK